MVTIATHGIDRTHPSPGAQLTPYDCGTSLAMQRGSALCGAALPATRAGVHGHTEQTHAHRIDGTHPTRKESKHGSELAGGKLKRTSSAMQLRIRSLSLIVFPMKYAPP